RSLSSGVISEPMVTRGAHRLGNPHPPAVTSKWLKSRMKDKRNIATHPTPPTPPRQKRGVSAADVPQHTGISRETIYAIEPGSYGPNTAVALRLARTL